MREEAGDALKGCKILVRSLFDLLILVIWSKHKFYLGFNRINHTEYYGQVDPMDDRANKAYASLPERLYVVQDGQVLYQVRMPIMTTILVRKVMVITSMISGWLGSIRLQDRRRGRLFEKEKIDKNK